MSDLDVVVRNLKQAESALATLLASPETLGQITSSAKLMADSFAQGGRVFSCGNGGSMCDAMHFAEELSGRYRQDRKALPAVSISDPSHISCVGNDYGYDFIFSRYLEAHARKGDVLLGISTSGKSANVIKAAEYARQQGIHVALLIVDAGIEPLAGAPPGQAVDALADPRELASAVLFLADQGARSATHELQVTPLAERWVP